ncbi:MAG TPA: hypothetical protein VMU49_08745 [Candidatus Acidoferrales bacterium]|nr:hypothetical protein [Candidatus Acidoferrales bacterium]
MPTLLVISTASALLNFATGPLPCNLSCWSWFQALAGVLLPSATVLLVLLSNDRAVLRPWTNPPWLNVVAVVAVVILLEMSGLLTLTTLFGGLNVGATAVVLAVLLAAGLAGLAVTRTWRRKKPPIDGTPWERVTWPMPPLETLAPPIPSRARAVGEGFEKSISVAPLPPPHPFAERHPQIVVVIDPIPTSWLSQVIAACPVFP